MKFIITFVSLFFTFLGRFKKSKPRRTPSKEDKAKRAVDYPDPFPNGWFNVLNSTAVKNEQVVEVEAFGQKLAVFRGKNGKVSVVDAFCPHLMANLAGGACGRQRVNLSFSWMAISTRWKVLSYSIL